jgi:2'-phosphotransferase
MHLLACLHFEAIYPALSPSFCSYILNPTHTTQLTPPQLEWQHLETNNITFPEIHAFATSDPLARFTLKSKTPASPIDPKAPLAPSNYLIALTTSLAPPDISPASLTPLSLAADNLPELVIYATTYAAYATILEEKQITNRSGTQIHFTTKIPDDAEVLIYIDIVAALEQGQKWLVHEAKGVVVTQGKGGAVESAFWKKVVGKKGGLGMLFENGEVVKEVPVGAKKAVGKRARRRSGENLSAGKAGLVEVEVEEEDEE